MKRKKGRGLAGSMAGVVMMLLMGVSVLAAQTHGAVRHYVAKLEPLNTQAAGSRARGELRMSVRGDTLTINLQMEGVPPGMMHMVHLHGFVDGSAAACPKPTADVNHDGVIDLHETEAASGVTLIPFNQDPAALNIAAPGYPTATASGRLEYRKTVSLSKLDHALAASDHGATADLSHRVVYIHGVPDETHLPATAASLPGVPAQATLPIACGVIRLVRPK